MLTVVGIDPSKLTGLAVVRRTEDGRFRVMNLRTLDVPDTWDGAPGSAIRIFQEAIALAEFAEGQVAVALEMPFGNRTGNLGSYGAQMLLVGGLLALLTDAGYAHVRVTPQEAKLALTGDHYAKKPAVVAAACALLGAQLLGRHRKLEREAMADAIAVALSGAAKLAKAARAPQKGVAA